MSTFSAGKDTVRELIAWVEDARGRSLDLIADLSDKRLTGPRMEIINPLLWEIGHVAWFQEKWVLRHVVDQEPLRPDEDALYDSIAIPHDDRWSLPLPSRDETFDYVTTVRDRVLELLHTGPVSDELAYFVKYAVFHEDMHTGLPATPVFLPSPDELHTKRGGLCTQCNSMVSRRRQCGCRLCRVDAGITARRRDSGRHVPSRSRSRRRLRVRQREVGSSGRVVIVRHFPHRSHSVTVCCIR